MSKRCRCVVWGLGLSYVSMFAVGAKGAEFVTTSAHPLPSTMSFQLFVVPTGEDASDTPTVVSGPIPFHGTGLLDATLDGAGDGVVNTFHGQFALEDSTGVIDLGALGSFDYEITGMQFVTSFGGKVVDANAFSFVQNALGMQITAGIVTLFNAQGPLLDSVGAGVFTTYNYTNGGPFILGPGAVEGTVDLGPGLFASAGEINYNVPPSDLSGLFDAGAYDVDVRFVSTHHLAVPEPASCGLALIGAVGLLVCAQRRRGRRSAR